MGNIWVTKYAKKARFKKNYTISTAYKVLKKGLEARAGIEPTYKDLQSSA